MSADHYIKQVRLLGRLHVVTRPENFVPHRRVGALQEDHSMSRESQSRAAADQRVSSRAECAACISGHFSVFAWPTFERIHPAQTESNLLQGDG